MSSSWPQPRLIFWVLLPSLLLLDQGSKHWIRSEFWVGQSREIVPGFLNLTYVLNDGMAFGLFQGNNLLLGLIVLGILCVMLWWSRQLNWRSWEVNLVGAMILSGALGNLTDRIRFGHVIDFVDVYYRNFHWPVFNVADSCISISMVWVLIRMWKQPAASESDARTPRS
ncbi:MAG: signal peptidase II [Blastochloris sp.]|nr:signal peptidase II [Blastochloris sp.]